RPKETAPHLDSTRRRTVQPAAEWVRLLGYSCHWLSDFGNTRLWLAPAVNSISLESEVAATKNSPSGGRDGRSEPLRAPLFQHMPYLLAIAACASSKVTALPLFGAPLQ